MTFVLRPHQCNLESPYKIQGEVLLRDGLVNWTMDVEMIDESEWVTESRFGNDPRKNWELWNYDVVETFLQPRMEEKNIFAPYLELQVSPLNQGLALMILKPRLSVYTPLEIPLESKVELSPKRWITRAKVRLPQELEQGALFGGLFACLGSAERGFFSTAPNPEERPDFHRPELFIKL